MLKGFKIGLNETQLGISMPLAAIELTKNIISARQTEMALTNGTLFTTEEALNIGLVDEIANEKLEALQKCLKFLKKSSKVSQIARAQTKQFFRKSVIDLLEGDREKDIEAFVTFIQNPGTQKMLSAFLKPPRK